MLRTQHALTMVSQDIAPPDALDDLPDLEDDASVYSDSKLVFEPSPWAADQKRSPGFKRLPSSTSTISGGDSARGAEAQILSGPSSRECLTVHFCFFSATLLVFSVRV